MAALLEVKVACVFIAFRVDMLLSPAERGSWWQFELLAISRPLRSRREDAMEQPKGGID